jgi:hypothetical protein
VIKQNIFHLLHRRGSLVLNGKLSGTAEKKIVKIFWFLYSFEISYGFQKSTGTAARKICNI